MRFENKVAIITGSSRGIGKAIAILLAQKGAQVVINGRDAERLSILEKQLKEQSFEVLVVRADVSLESGADELIKRTLETFGKIDFLINNVGISSRGNLGELAPSVIKKVFESNIYGAVFPTIFAMKALRKTHGSIVFISSLAGIRGLPGLAPYCASKMALRAFVESIRIEEKEHRVHAGLLLVGITENEPDKEAIGSDGQAVVLAARNQGKVLKMQKVAAATIRMIEKKQYLKTLTAIGKLNAWMQARCPQWVEKIILMNIEKFKRGNQ